MQIEMEGIKVYVTESECRQLHADALQYISKIPEGRWVIEQCIKADEIEELDQEIKSNWFIYDTPREQQEEMIKQHWRLQYLLDMMYTNYGAVHGIEERAHETDEEDDKEMDEDMEEDEKPPQQDLVLGGLLGQLNGMRL
jgi:hypothetical protein